MKPEESALTIFNVALEQSDPAARALYLNEACGTDAALRERVEKLLLAHDEAGGFFSQPLNPTAPVPSTAATVRLTMEKAGDVIGRYKLLEQIGEGGCGVVYMAEQQEPVRRRVALKVIKLGMDTKQVVARFEAERQALALMDHPNIARVLDAGPTDTGRPYFVMELVRGIKITEFCDQKKLSTQERLELFVSVCRAIQHAHQKGIIHRDLKPSNLLVTIVDGAPVPKVIDFGIAKATSNQPLTDKTLFTAFAQFVGTPAYMSPEQAEMSGVDIDTRTDIYSLGVVLYELLTGKTPFDAEALLRAGIDEIRRTIRDQEPPKPSTRLHSLSQGDLTTTAQARHVDGHKLIQAVKGDLDWIVMKCLEKERGRRYETINGLAMDIKRHVNTEPVVARPPSAVYRFQKFIRRHRIATWTVAAIAAGLGISVAAIVWQARRADKAEWRAESVQLGRPTGRTNLVQTVADTGRGSLRQSVQDALNGDVIRFARKLSGQAIVLTNGEIPIHKHLTIDGSGLDQPIRISGNNASRVFEVDANRAVVLNSLVITEGYSPQPGGAIYTSGHLTLNQCVLSQCRGDYGGAIFQNDGVLQLNSCLVVSNTAISEGGGLFNTSDHVAAALVRNRTSLWIQNSTIAYNTSQRRQGGGFKSFQGSIVLVNSTLANNRAGTDGGGFRAFNALLAMTNCIVAGNSAGVSQYRDVSMEGTHLGGISNLISTPNILLAPLDDYGGPTLTMPPLIGSPAIDAGSDAITNSLAADQRGMFRFVGSHVDVGAVECQARESPAMLSAQGGTLRSNVVALLGQHDPEGFDARTALAHGLIDDRNLAGAEALLMVNLRDLGWPSAEGDREAFRRELRRFIELCEQFGRSTKTNFWRKVAADFDKPPTLLPQPSSEFHRLARMGQFSAAVAQLSEADPENDPAQPVNRETFIAFTRRCTVRLEAGDLTGYTNDCLKWLHYHSGKLNQTDARRLARLCLLVPLPAQETEISVRLANVAAADIQPTDEFRLVSYFVKALAEYRLNNFESALTSLDRMKSSMADKTNRTWPWPQGQATGSALAALCQFGLGNTNEARASLAEAQTQFESLWHIVGRQDLGINFHEYLIARALLRQAEAWPHSPVGSGPQKPDH